MDLLRLARHLLAPPWIARRAFPRRCRQEIEEAIAAGELMHASELRFVAEAGLPPGELLRGTTTRERAIDVFSQLRVWDTEQNSGVLIYVQLVDHRVEIVADRGVAARVAQAEWDAVCRGMEASFRKRDYRRGGLFAIERVSGILARHFPAPSLNPNELPDAPLML